MKVAILLLAAGRGSRLEASVPKAYLRLGGEPLLVHSAARLLAAMHDTEHHELLVLVHPDDRRSHLEPHMATLRSLLQGRASLKIVDGGATRQESMLRGLAATGADSGLVLVHDAARALVPVAAVRACLATATATGAAMLAIPATDTLKRVRNGRVVETIERGDVYYAQTPQIARRELFQRASDHARTTGFEATDDVALLEHADIEVAVVTGSTSNLKITRPDDLPIALALLADDPSPFPSRS